VDAFEARLVGQRAVQYSAEPGNSGSVAMRRLPADHYEMDIFLTPLHTVARETKKMEPEFISGGNNITHAFVDYAGPLVGGMPIVGSFDEMKNV
jgi:hypothetical protein